jgi:hypothetical protein
LQLADKFLLTAGCQEKVHGERKGEGAHSLDAPEEEITDRLSVYTQKNKTSK